MWTVTFRLNGDLLQKLFWDGSRMRDFIRRSCRDPKFHLVQIRQLVY